MLVWEKKDDALVCERGAILEAEVIEDGSRDAQIRQQQLAVDVGVQVSIQRETEGHCPLCPNEFLQCLAWLT